MSPKDNVLVLELPTGKSARIEGVTSLGDIQYFKITYNGKTAFIPEEEFVEKNSARTRLRKNGVIITSDPDWRDIVKSINDIRSFPTHALIEEPGWTGCYLADSSGRVYSPKGSPKGKALFRPSHQIERSKGRLKDWREQVAVPLTGQHLPMLAVLAAFAAPLLQLTKETYNFGFEFSGPPETGKTTCLRLMTSVVRCPSAIPNFNATLAGFESMFREHQDMPFPIDEANLADGSKKHMLDFAFRMANGTAKVTVYQPDRAQSRFIFATSANRPFHEALKSFDADTAGAALQRLMPLRITNNEIGVFDFVPKRFASSGAFVDYLEGVIKEQYGTPFARFLQELVNARAEDADKFQRQLERSIDQFATKVGIAVTARGKTRVTTTFGLLYAAGKLAKRWKILPKEWQCLQACVAGYRNYQRQLPAQTPFVTRLLAIATRPQTMDLRKKERPNLTDEQVREAGAFLVSGTGDRTELLMTDDLCRHYFPDWKRLQTNSDFRELNCRDGDHKTKQRHMRQGHNKERFICFILPLSIVPRVKTR